MPIRRAVLMMRQAISPRLAIRMRLNMRRARFQPRVVTAAPRLAGWKDESQQLARHCEAAESRRGNPLPHGRDCFAEFTLALAEGETRGLAMTRSLGSYAARSADVARRGLCRCEAIHSRMRMSVAS